MKSPTTLQHRSFDPSIVGFTAEEIEQLDPEETHETVVQLVNQAGDLLEGIANAFAHKLSEYDRQALIAMAREVQAHARSMDRWMNLAKNLADL